MGLLAFSAYVLAAPNTPYPLDSAELAWASFGWGIAHPPGEITALLWGKLFCYLPFGTIAFRVAMGQAVAGALAAVCVFYLVIEVGVRIPMIRDGLAPWLQDVVAAAAACSFAFAPGVVISSNRPEVYALQAALSLGALLLALRGHRLQKASCFFLSALCLGLGIGNHSLLAGLVGLGAVGLALFSVHHLGSAPRFFLWAFIAFGMGLLVHLYLPLRALALFSQNSLDTALWGDSRTWRGFWWIVSAKTFTQKNSLVQGNASPWDLPYLPMEELGPPLALIAFFGVYLVLRTTSSRIAGVGLLLGAAGSFVAALIAGMDPSNPDTRGYLVPALGMVSIFSGIALSFAIARFGLLRLRLVLALIFLIGALSRFPAPGNYPGLRHAQAASRTTSDLLASLPVRAVLFTHHFETGFLVGYHRLIEAQRPDVDWAHLAFAGESGYRERVARSAPALSPVVDLINRGAPASIPLQTLAKHRPVRLEADAVTPLDLRRALFPAGEFWSPVASTEMPTPLSDLVLAETTTDRQVRGYHAWRAYIDAIWACEHHAFQRAQIRFKDLEQLVPKDQRFVDLKHRCATLSKTNP